MSTSLQEQFQPKRDQQPPDVKDLLVKQGGRWGALSSGFALLTARWHGMRYWEKRSEDIIGRVSPHPVLLIAGTADRVVSSSMTEKTLPLFP